MMDSTINFLPGRSIVIFLPNGEQHKGRFAITELSDILPSHHEKTFETSAGYPTDREGKNINDRNYTDDPAAKAEVKLMAQHLAPEQLLSTSRVADGSPIITQTGIVISGNNRTMSLKLAATDFPENYAHYKNILIEELPAFGIESKDYDARNFSQPVLVRIDYDITNPSTSDLSKFNKDTKKTERPIDIALKLRKMLADSERYTSVISDIVKNYETFSEFRANFNDEKRLRDTLLECNIMVRQEMNRYWYERGFTDEGMDLLENMLSGIILEPDALRAGMESGVKQIRNILIVSLPVLIKNKTLPKKYSLISVINKAIILEAKIQASGLIRTDYLAQEKLFEEKPDIDTVYMNELLHLGRNKFKDAVERYNTSADAALIGNMFGDAPQPEQMFDVFIKRSIPEPEVKVIERYFGKQEHVKETPVPAAPATRNLSEKVRIFMQMLQGPEMAMQHGGNTTLNGKGKNMSVEDIAALHKVQVKQIRGQLGKGMNIELEHTSDLLTAKYIAMDHLVENPLYYDKLEEMEKTFAAGGNMQDIEKLIREEHGGETCGICEHDNSAFSFSLEHGGIVKGKRHSEGGEKFNLDGHGMRVELEAGEPVVPEQLLNDNKQYTITGTNRQVLNKIMGMAGVSLNDKVTQVKSGDVVICRLSANDDAPRKYTGTLRQIISAVNTSSGECNMVEPGAKVQELQPA